MRNARLIVSSLLCLALLLGLASVLHAQKGRDKEKEKSSGTSSAAPQTKREGNKAKIAVARKLAVIMFGIWRDGTHFQFKTETVEPHRQMMLAARA